MVTRCNLERPAINILKSMSLAVLLCLMMATAGAQTDVGKIFGTITDKTGAAVPGASITATEEQTGTSQLVKTNESGNYVFPSLASGTYTITGTAPGFQTGKQLHIALDASASRNVEFQLSVGQVNQEVVVDTVSQNQVNTTDAQIASTITGKQIENIALNGRNYVQLLRLLPGTVSVTLDPFAIQLGAMSTYVNGVRGASLLNMADGIILQDISANISVFSVPSADSIAETRVLAASFSAENPSPYGGATINAITKSGGHDFHGNLFEFNRNTIFNSKQDFATTNLPLHFNDYGFTFGGPLYVPGKLNRDRTKLFFFASEEWKIIHQSTVGTGTVPTAAQLGGVFTTAVYQPGTKTPYPSGSCTQNPAVLNTPATGYCIPQSALNAAGQNAIIGAALLKPYPLPNVSAGGTNYQVSIPNKLDNREDRYNFDYVPTEKDRFSVRFAKSQNNQSAGGALLIVPYTLTPRPSFIYSFGYTRTFTPSLLNTLVIGETHNTFTTMPNEVNLTLAALGLNNTVYQQINGNAVNVLGSGPTTAITGFTTINPGNKDTKTNVNLLLSDDLSWVKGNHTLKFGTYLQHGKIDEHNLSATSTQGSITFSTNAAATTGNALGDVLLGNFYQDTQSTIPGFFLLRYLDSEFYAQDNWRATKNVAIEYGIRYVYSQLPYNDINNGAYFNPSVYASGAAPTFSTATTGPLAGSITGRTTPYTNGLQIVGGGLTSDASKFFSANQLAYINSLGINSTAPKTYAPTPKSNFAPRVGVAYDVFGNGKTSVRLGYGIFFMRQNTFEYSAATQNLPFNYQATIYNSNFTNLATLNGTSLIFPTSVYSIPTQYKSAYIQTRNLGVQQQLPKSLILDVNYVGNQALHMPILININQLQPGAVQANPGVNVNLLRPYKGFADIDQQVYADTSNYNSLQMTIGRRVRSGLNFSTSFTLSKTLEGTSQNIPASMIPENSYNYKADYGIADINRSKVTTGNVVYELPFFKTSHNHLLSETLGGWTVAGVFQFQTGAPLNPTIPTDIAGISTATATGGMAERPNRVPGVDPYTHQNCGGQNKFPVCQFLNPAAFDGTPYNAATNPNGIVPGTFGNSARNSVNGPSYTATDASVYKHFHFGDRYDAQFRAEGFNIFNRDSLTTVGTSVTTTTFGQVTATAPGRVLQFGAKFAF